MHGPRLCSAPSKGRCAASGARDEIESFSLAIRRTIAFSRLLSPELCCSFRPRKTRERREGRAPAAPAVRVHGKRTRGGPQVCRSPGLPCADGFNGVLRALLGERCTIAPVALRMIDARARSGRRITALLDASLRASGPHDFSVRGRFDLIAGSSRVLAPDDDRNRCDRAVRPASRMTHGCPPCHRFPRRRCRVHRTPTRIS